MINELKVIQKKFGCIATSLEDGSAGNKSWKLNTIMGWRHSTERIRVFDSVAFPEIAGIDSVKITTTVPTLKAMIQDHYLGLRTAGPIVLCSPTLHIKPVCEDLYSYAASKHMGISWSFSDPFGGLPYPSVIGFTTGVSKILSEETPEDVLFVDGQWQPWLHKWLMTHMQPHRRFEYSIAYPEQPEVIVEAIEKPVKKKKK